MTDGWKGRTGAFILRAGPALLWLALILVLTLRPDERSAELGLSLDPMCLVCGERGAADFLLNIAFFVPFGFALARWVGWLPALVVGISLSIAVETAQAAVPGRFPTISDVLTNSIGTALGVGLWLAWPRIASIPQSSRVALAALAATVTLLPALLLAPSPTPYDYYAQWAPSIPGPDGYRGRVLEASIGRHAAPLGLQPSSDSVRAGLSRGAPVEIRFITSTPPRRRSSVFRFVDARTDEIASIEIRRNALVWVQRTVASSLRFETVPLVWPDALADVKIGEELHVVVTQENGRVCMVLNARRECPVVPSLRDGWQLLLAPDGGPPLLAAAAGLFWLGLPSALLGLAVSPRRVFVLAAAAAVVVAVTATALLSPWIRLSPGDVLVGAGSVIGGGAVARVWRRYTQARFPAQVK